MTQSHRTSCICQRDMKTTLCTKYEALFNLKCLNHILCKGFTLRHMDRHKFMRPKSAFSSYPLIKFQRNSLSTCRNESRETEGLTHPNLHALISWNSCKQCIKRREICFTVTHFTHWCTLTAVRRLTFHVTGTRDRSNGETIYLLEQICSCRRSISI